MGATVTISLPENLRQELDKLEAGEILEVVADDPAAEEDIPRLAERLGHKLLEMKREGEELRFLIEKG